MHWTRITQKLRLRKCCCYNYCVIVVAAGADADAALLQEVLIYLKNNLKKMLGLEAQHHHVAELPQDFQHPEE